MDIVFGNEVMDCNHAVVFELHNFDGIFWAEKLNIFEK